VQPELLHRTTDPETPDTRRWGLSRRCRQCADPAAPVSSAADDAAMARAMRSQIADQAS